MQNDDSTGFDRAKRLLFEIREQVIIVRSRYLSELARGEVSPQTEQALRDIAIEYYEALREHRDEAVVKDAWSESGVGQLEHLLSETTTVQRPKPGYGTSNDVVEVPMIHQVDPHKIVQFTRKMDDLCKLLGFSPSVNQSTPRIEIGDDLIQEVEEWRQNHLS